MYSITTVRNKITKEASQILFAHCVQLQSDLYIEDREYNQNSN